MPQEPGVEITMESEPQVHDYRGEQYNPQDTTKTRSGRTVKPTKYLQYDVKGTPSVSEISCRKVTPDTAASDHLHNRSSGCSCVKKTLKTKKKVSWALEEKLCEVVFIEPRDVITPVKTMNQPTLCPTAPVFYPARYRNRKLWMDAFKVVPVVNINTDQYKQ